MAPNEKFKYAIGLKSAEQALSATIKTCPTVSSNSLPPSVHQVTTPTLTSQHNQLILCVTELVTSTVVNQLQWSRLPCCVCVGIPVFIHLLFNPLYIPTTYDRRMYTKSTIQLVSVEFTHTSPFELTIIVGFHQLLLLA